jgi:amidase
MYHGRVIAGDLADRSAVDVTADVRTRKVSVRDVVAACLARIEQVDGVVNAVCTVSPEALADAEAADRRLASGAPARRLEGVPFLVKDVIPTRGLLTTYGSKLHERFVPDEDALSVERLRAAGAILLGKTNTPEFATDVYTTNALFGPTRNPWDARTTAGGSSGGSGAAVAAGMAPLALGTDFGGSVRLPASFCGIVGLRPAPGRIPLYPAEFAWDTLVAHVQGPMTRTVEDAALMLAVLAGPDDRDPTSHPADGTDYAAAGRAGQSLAGRRFAWCGDLGGLVPVEPEIARLAGDATQALAALGAIVEDVAFDASDVKEIIAGTRAFAMVARFGERVEAHAARMAEPLVRQVTDARTFDVKAVARAERMRSAYYQRVRALLERHDYIVTPTAGVAAFRIDQPLPSVIGGRPVARFYDAFLFTYAFSVTGLPAISVPCGFTAAGLPVGLQIVGRRLREDRVLEAAAAMAAAAPQHYRRPPLESLPSARDLGESVRTTGFSLT